MFSFASMQARRSQFLMGASVLALVMNTILNFALIPRWGMYGAAYATLVAYVIEAIVMYWLSQRVFRLDYEMSRTLTAMGIFAGVLIVTQIHWSPLSYARPLALGTTGLAAFGALVALGFNRIKLLRFGLIKTPAS
jgi:O-antigen/teichoic acid export membrane protein